MDTDSHQRTVVAPWRYLRLRPGLTLLAASLLALLMVAAQHGLALWRSAETPMQGAQWIWAPETGKAPTAFYAARDFALAAPPDVQNRGRLAIVADESYIVYLNGLYLGANTYRQGAAIDTYDLTGKLRTGRNRLVIELRSQRGVGGLLADLRILEHKANDPKNQNLDDFDHIQPLLVSDDRWQIFKRHDEVLFDLERRLANGAPAVVWALSPTGRWRPGAHFLQRPLLDDGKRPQRKAPKRMRGVHSDRWIDLHRPRKHLPEAGPEVLFDWGQKVEGFLYLDLPNSDTPPALIYYGDEPPDSQERPPDHVIIPMPGTDQWRDLHPRRFRYVLLVGVEPRSRIEARLVEPALAAQLAPPPPAKGGVFGLRPALRHTSVEEMVWRRLQQEALARQSSVSKRIESQQKPASG